MGDTGAERVRANRAVSSTPPGLKVMNGFSETLGVRRFEVMLAEVGTAERLRSAGQEKVKIGSTQEDARLGTFG